MATLMHLYLFIGLGSLFLGPRRMDPFLEEKVCQRFKDVKLQNPGRIDLALI
jgi:hypothetical protein